MESVEYGTMFRVEDTHWWYRALHQLIFDMLERDLPDWRSKTMLDAGCGTGAILKLLGNPDRNVGVDLSPEALSYCRKRGLHNVQQADVTALPYAGNSFDGVICSSVLYHQWVADPASAVSELHRVLRPGGVLVLNVPALRFLQSPHDEAVMGARRFRKDEVESLLGSAGFSVRRLTYWTTLLFPLAVIARTFGASKMGRDFRTENKRSPLDFIFSAIMSTELQLLKKTSLPVGVALLATAEKLT